MSIAAFAEASQYVGGSWRRAAGPPQDVVDPTSEETLISLPSATAEVVAGALAAAAEAWPAWAAAPTVIRAGHLRQIADLLEAHKDELADLLVQEVGKPQPQAVGEVEFAQTILRYTAEWDRRLEGEILPGDVPGEEIHLRRIPLGVVVAICPWNYPLAVFFRKVAPALLTGNTVVAKPSEVTPLTTLRTVQLIDEHLDLPAGVLNLITGAGSTGQALVESPLTAAVSFTGHRDTGKRVMASAAANLTRVSLELGGKAPAIVWRDADLDVAIPAIVAARHTNSGQVCTCAERVLVHRDLLDEFSDRYTRAVSALTLGSPAVAGVDMGPLVNAAQFGKTSAAVAGALDEGASVVTGGGRPEGEAFARGYWFAPTVLRDVRPDMRVMREETFGPVTPILGIESIDDALRIANDSRYGLSAYLFSRDYETIMRSVNDLQFGEIYINRTLGESVHAHHAGLKESGIGGEDGKWGLLRYTQIKTAYHHYRGLA
ncbi:MAG TPA: aldehyde dehydrogenase family protein [Candidatus Dormibacteraeota bacterium]|jgi:lactaldehyde dehydrogenase/glycolaldehyde dehydrogenase|nr:aldehyde dehydrogenase family protein [Candidatus Dormibacteraeota bacterium]